jgi:hypothetical protein
LNPDAWKDPSFKERVTETRDFEDPSKIKRTQDENAQLLFERIQKYAFVGQTSTSAIAAPPCKQQEPFKPIYGSGPSTQYQHTFQQSSP